MPFYPNVDRSVTGTNSGTYTGGPAKGVLHTTEGSSGSGAISAFQSSGSWPHFLVGSDGHIWQFIDTGLAARALQNLAGGVETNRDHAIQIEIVGFAGQPTNHPAAQWNALKSLMRWIESVEGVKPIGPGRAFADHYGQAGIRFDNATWDNFGGWCGHCHVPENDHWDPGAIDINSLLPSPTTHIGAQYVNLHLDIVASAKTVDGRVYLAQADGSFFGFEVPPITGANGQSYFVGRKVARLYNNSQPEVPAYARGNGDGLGISIQTESNEFYGPYYTH